MYARTAWSLESFTSTYSSPNPSTQILRLCLPLPGFSLVVASAHPSPSPPRNTSDGWRKRRIAHIKIQTGEQKCACCMCITLKQSSLDKLSSAARPIRLSTNKTFRVRKCKHPLTKKNKYFFSPLPPFPHPSESKTPWPCERAVAIAQVVCSTPQQRGIGKWISNSPLKALSLVLWTSGQQTVATVGYP